MGVFWLKVFYEVVVMLSVEVIILFEGLVGGGFDFRFIYVVVRRV